MDVVDFPPSNTLFLQLMRMGAVLYSPADENGTKRHRARREIEDCERGKIYWCVELGTRTSMHSSKVNHERMVFVS